jgi:hypothetical protein
MDSKAPNKPANAVDNYTGISELNARYRHRETGVGYGKSSGYATERRYATTAPSHPIRVR